MALYLIILRKPTQFNPRKISFLNKISFYLCFLMCSFIWKRLFKKFNSVYVSVYIPVHIPVQISVHFSAWISTSICETHFYHFQTVIFQSIRYTENLSVRLRDASKAVQFNFDPESLSSYGFHPRVLRPSTFTKTF